MISRVMMKPHIILTTYKERFRMFTKHPTQNFLAIWTPINFIRPFTQHVMDRKSLYLHAFINGTFDVQLTQHLLWWTTNQLEDIQLGVAFWPALPQDLPGGTKIKFIQYSGVSLQVKNKPGHSRIQTCMLTNQCLTFGPKT